MDSSIVTAGAAVMGSMVGAFASLGSAWVTQRNQSRRDHVSRQLTRRETLYADFINEAARLYTDALVSTMEKPESMAKIWGLLSRIRLSSTEPVLAEAERVMHAITEQFMAETLTLAEIHQLTLRSDPLKNFGDLCRVELDALDTRIADNGALAAEPRTTNPIQQKPNLK